MVNINAAQTKPLQSSEPFLSNGNSGFVSSSALLQKTRKKMRREDTTTGAQELRGHPSHRNEIWCRTSLLHSPQAHMIRDGLRDDFHVHIPTAPFSSVCSFHTVQVLPRANTIAEERYSKSPMKLRWKGKDTDKFAIVEVKEKHLNEQEELAQLWFSNHCFN